MVPTQSDRTKGIVARRQTDGYAAAVRRGVAVDAAAVQGEVRSVIAEDTAAAVAGRAAGDAAAIHGELAAVFQTHTGAVARDGEAADAAAVQCQAAAAGDVDAAGVGVTAPRDPAVSAVQGQRAEGRDGVNCALFALFPEGGDGMSVEVNGHVRAVGNDDIFGPVFFKRDGSGLRIVLNGHQDLILQSPLRGDDVATDGVQGEGARPFLNADDRREAPHIEKTVAALHFGLRQLGFVLACTCRREAVLVEGALCVGDVGLDMQDVNAALTL